MKPPTVPFPRLPIVKHFQRSGQRINTKKSSRSLVYFSPTVQTFGCANSGADSLENETFGNVHSLPSSRVTQRCPSSNVVRHGTSSPTSPPCPRPVAVPFWGAAWESPTARGSGGGVLPRRLELQCWVLPLHLQGQSRLQIHQVNCNVPYKLSRRKTTKAPPGNFY